MQRKSPTRRRRPLIREPCDRQHSAHCKINQYTVTADTFLTSLRDDGMISDVVRYDSLIQLKTSFHRSASTT